MTTQPQPEALRLANQLRDILPAFCTPSHERGVLNGAIQRLEQLHAECEALRRGCGMTTQPQPEALRLAEAMKQRVIPRWVHATGETPRQSGFAADAECQAAADMLLRLHAECEALRMERDALRAAANNGGWMGYFDDEVGKLRAECEALRADAERWRKWLPWIGGLNRKPFGLAMEIKQIDAARAAKEQSNG